MATKRETIRELQNDYRREIYELSKTSNLTEKEEAYFDKCFDEIRKLDEDYEREERKVLREIENFRAKEPTLWPLESLKRKRADSLALRHYLATGKVHESLRGLMVRLAAQSTTDGEGGYTVPQSIVNGVDQALKSLGGMWQVSKVVKTKKGNLLTWPTTNDTVNEAYIIAENGNMTTSATSVVFGVEEFLGFKYTSGLIEVPFELTQDSEMFEENFIDILSQRIFRGTNRHFSVGNGSTEPNGIANSATYGVSSADDQAIAHTDLINVLHSVDAAYRKNWMFHDSVLKHLRGLKEGTTNARLFPELDEGKLLGLPYVINNHLAEFVPGIGNDGKKILMVGDFSKYIIRTVRDIAIRRVEGPSAEKDGIGFAAILRADGDLLDAGTHPVKYLRMANT